MNSKRNSTTTIKQQNKANLSQHARPRSTFTSQNEGHDVSIQGNRDNETQNGHVYGTLSTIQSQDVVGSGANLSIEKLNWSRSKCIPRMINVFFKMSEEFVQRKKRITRFMIDEKEHNWWQKASEAFNCSDDDFLNYNLLKEEAYPVELRSLEPVYRTGYLSN